MKTEKLLRHNSKLKDILAFNIPAKKTCPTAGECKNGCYADMGLYNTPIARASAERKLYRTMADSFTDDVINEIKRRRKKCKIRIHDGGDFYSERYFLKWYRVAEALPDVEFYAYTKRVSMTKNFFKVMPRLNNLTLIYSFGGTEDHLIDIENDRHSMVFSKEIPADYIDASHDDHMALTNNKKIGLVYHGYKSRTWGK